MDFGASYCAWSLFICLFACLYFSFWIKHYKVLQCLCQSSRHASMTPVALSHTLLLYGNTQYPSKAMSVWPTAKLISPHFAAAHLTIHVVFWMKGNFDNIPPRWQQLLLVKPGRDCLVALRECVLWGTWDSGALTRLFTPEHYCASLACLSAWGQGGLFYPKSQFSAATKKYHCSGIESHGKSFFLLLLLWALALWILLWFLWVNLEITCFCDKTEGIRLICWFWHKTTKTRPGLAR